VRKVEEADEGWGPAGCFTFRFAVDEAHPVSSTPEQLVCVSETRTLMHRWISGTQARMQRQQESGAPRARRVWIDVLSEAADEASHAEESDGDEQSSGENEPPREQRKAGSRQAAPTRRGIGIRCHNLSWSPIGAELEIVEPNSPAEAAGLRVGDVIVAVGGQACYSHFHTCRLLGRAPSPIELIVWHPLGVHFAKPRASPTAHDDDPPELS